MPTTMASGHGLASTGTKLTAFERAQFRTVEFAVAIWALSILLFATLASFSGKPAFLGDFDVTVAAF